jgi:hypothetical protein
MPSVVMEQQIVSRALHAGLSAERLGQIFGLEPAALTMRLSFLTGVCDEAIAMLATSPASEGTFQMLKRMAPARQVEAAATMISLGIYSRRLGLALLRLTPPDQLIQGFRDPNWTEHQREAGASCERRFASTAERTARLGATHANATLELVILRAYARKLLTNAKLVGRLARTQSDRLQQLQHLADLDRLPGGVQGGDGSVNG